MYEKIRKEQSMSEKLVKGILGTFGGLTGVAFGKELLVFIISLLPISSLCNFT